jgi:hypothetical protein
MRGKYHGRERNCPRTRTRTQANAPPEAYPKVRDATGHADPGPCDHHDTLALGQQLDGILERVPFRSLFASPAAIRHQGLEEGDDFMEGGGGIHALGQGGTKGRKEGGHGEDMVLFQPIPKPVGTGVIVDGVLLLRRQLHVQGEVGVVCLCRVLLLPLLLL